LLCYKVKYPTQKKSSIYYFDNSLHIQDAKGEIFGFIISKSGNGRNPNYSVPCEYLTFEGFNMLKASGKVESVIGEEIHYFIPLYVNPNHGKIILFFATLWTFV
jgi:hypothetical protein